MHRFVESFRFQGMMALVGRSVLVSIACLFVTAQLRAQTTWNITAANGNWGTAGNWTPATVPGGAGAVVNLTNGITAARTVTIDTTSRSVGDLNIGASTAFGFTLASSATTVVLNLDGTGTTAATVDFTTNANTISAPITLVDNGIFRSNIQSVQTLSGIISGARTVTYNNDTNGTVNAPVALQGQFSVTGANTYSAGTFISDVRVAVGTATAALGTGLVTVQSGGQVYSNGGTRTNNFNITGNGWLESGGAQLGALRLDNGTVISGNVTLAADAGIGSQAGTGTVSGVISGNFALAKRGVTTFVLSGANTYTGGTTVTGILQLNNNTAAGPGPISIDTNATSSRLVINGGVTIANNVSMATPGGTAGVGTFAQTGTGLGTINGTVTITGNPAAGGHFSGGAIATNALVLNGAISSTVPLNHRAGFVRYGGGGTGYDSLLVAGTAQVGATNGIPVGATLTLGASATNGTFDLNGFDQTLAGAPLGHPTLAQTGTILLGGNTLTLNNNLISLASTVLTANVINNAVTATASGSINFGSTPRTIDVGETPSLDDLSLNGVTVAGTGGVTKTGLGTLSLTNTTITNPFTFDAGTVATGTSLTVGSFSSNSLTLGAGTTSLRMKIGTGADVITVTTANGLVTSGGTTTFNISQFGGALPVGIYNLINYTGTSPGLTGFTLNTPIGHAIANLTDTGSAIALQVTANDRVIWDGTNTQAWATGVTGNWKLLSNGNPTDYIESDDVIFQDNPTSSTVTIGATVFPSKVTFTNTVLTPYTLTGTAGIGGTTVLLKTGDGIVDLGTPNTYSGATTIGAGTLNLTGSLTGSNITVATGATLTATGSIGGVGSTLTSSGTVILRPTTTANTYTGATTISAGTFTANYTTALALSAVTPVSVASGATLRLEHDGGVFSLVNTLTGSGTVIIDPSVTIAGVRDIATVTWDASGFTGVLRLAPTNGTMRMNVNNPVDLGSGTVEVATGGQIFVSAANLTFSNAITLSGIGFTETAGNLGAIRATTNTTFTGPITISGDAKIGALGGVANFTNSISGGILTFGGSNNNSSETMNITGNASGLAGLVVNDGTATGNANSILVNVGNGTTTGSLGTVPVSLFPDGFKNAVIRFDRTDGYTLGGAISLNGAAAPANYIRSFVDLDSQGTGFSDNGLAINLGGNLGTTGGQLRIGQSRADSLTNFTGAVTAGTFLVGVNAGAVANLNSTTTFDVGTVRVGIGAGTSTLNINTGSTLNAFSIGVGEGTSGSGVLNQATGSTVNINSQLRVGHFGTLTATYNMVGGTLIMTGESPLASPSTAGGGGAALYGDNNLNTLPANTLVGGGIYIGIDGMGIFNHSGGTVTTNWIVLDNRGATGAGANMSDGLDRYTISGSSILNIRSNWGLIGRNEGSYVVSFGGGTINVDNTGTGTGTGANIIIPIDATIDTVTATTTKLDTLTSGNGFTFTKDIRGTGTLNLIGGGTVNFTTDGVQSVSPTLTGNVNVVKLGTGVTTLSGTLSGLSGIVTVSAGVLNVSNSLATAVTVADGAALAGEPTVTALTLGTVSGSTVYFNPNTTGSLTSTTTFTAVGVTTLELTTVPTGTGPYTAITYSGPLAGGGTFAIANPVNYRVAPVVTDTGSAITVNFTGGKALTWTGAASTAWDINGAINWSDSTPAPDVFFNGDSVTFPEGGANSSIALTGLLSPFGITVNAATTAYTFTSTAGNQIAGPTGITKLNDGTLTLVGPNLYTGVTNIGGGTLAFNVTDSLGVGVAGNSIALSGGGRLQNNGASALNLGVSRAIAVGTGGGTISHSSATAVTITIPGNISGTTALSFQSVLAGAGTFALSGDNSGYTGAISVDAVSTGLSTLQIATNSASPSGGSITVNFPAAGANGNANTLNLRGTTLSAGVTLNMTSLLNGTISLRTQVTSSGDAYINGPITASGSTIVQMNPSNGTLTLAGPIGVGVGGYNTATSAFFLRGVGNGVVTGTITLPDAFVSKTDTGSWTISSTGNNWLSTAIGVGTLRMGVAGAMPAAVNLVLGQNDGNTVSFNLDGFNQVIGSLASNPTAVGANTTGKSITSVAPATLSVNQSVDTIYAGVFSGAVSLVKNGLGSLWILGAGSQTGATVINAGVLRIGTATSMGTNTSVTITSGATLDVNGVGRGAVSYVVSVSGSGVAGQAAIWNSGVGVTNNPVYGTIVLAGDTTIGGTGRYDINGGTGGTTFNGSTFSLTKVGTNDLWWAPNPGATVGNIIVNEGVFGVQSSNNLGDIVTSAITVNANGNLRTFSTVTNDKPVVINGGNFGSNSATGTWTGTVTLSGAGTTNRISPASATLTILTGQLTGLGGFEKLNPGTLELQNGTNNYTGNTLVTAGVLVLSGNGTFATSPVVTVGSTTGSTAVLQGSALTGGPSFSANGLTLATGQTLSGNGTVVSTIGFSSPANSTLSPGTDVPGTLTVTANTKVNGAYAFKVATAGTGFPNTITNGGSSTLPTTNHDVFAVTGTADVTGLVFNISSLGTTGFDSTSYYSWTALTSTAGLTFTLAPTIGTVTGADFIAAQAVGTFSIATDANNVYVNFAPIPEPAFLCFAAFGAFAVLRRGNVRKA